MSIELVVVDLDGTLLNSKHEMSERNETVLKKAIEQGIRVVIATGKTRTSGLEIAKRLSLDTPGIYLQGLTVYKADGTLMQEQTLEPDVARQVITFAEDRGFDVVIYSGEQILVRTLDDYSKELANKYHEPTPEAVGPLQNVLGRKPVNKVLILRRDQPERITALRWQLGMQLDGKARMVQAMIPDMLEVLPPNSSKGVALKALLKSMNFTPDQVLAIGDGENDLEMIELAGIGVAVGNADPKLKEAADHIVGTNDKDAVAEALEKFVLKPEPADKTEEVKEKA